MPIENIKTPDDLLQEAKVAKYREIWQHSNSLIDAEIKNSDASENTKKRQRLIDKSHSRITKQNNGVTLTSSEKADEAWFVSFLKWEDTINSEADNACNHVKAMSDMAHVSGYDVDVDIIFSNYTAAYEEWVQGSYAEDAVVMHNGTRWLSIIDNNVSEPDNVYNVDANTGDWLPV